MKKLAKQVGSAKKQTMGSKLSYIKKNWQLYVFFLMPFNSHPRFPFCKRVSHFESDLQILYPTFHFCNDFPVFSLAFMI